MSVLTELRTLLDGMELCNTIECRECERTECPSDVLRDMLFDAAGEVPVLRALVAAAETTEGMDTCPCCLEERYIPGWPVQSHLKWCPLAPLVKEADDE